MTKEKLLIDTREPAIVSKLFRESFDVEVKRLDVGDVVYNNICFERKTGDDFISSICDNRLRMQIKMMTEWYDDNYIIIEGGIYKDDRNIHTNALLGSLCSVVSSGVKIIQVPSSTKHFCYVVKGIIKRIGRDDVKINPIIDRRIAKADKIPAMLTVIDGMSFKKAQQICEAFNIESVSDLLKINNESFMEAKRGGELEGIGNKIFERLMEVVDGKSKT